MHWDSAYLELCLLCEYDDPMLEFDDMLPRFAVNGLGMMAYSSCSLMFGPLVPLM